MKTTIKNLKENKNISIISGYLRLRGTVKIFSKGKEYDEAQKRTKDYKVKNAILVTPKKLFDLDKCEPIQIKK